MLSKNQASQSNEPAGNLVPFDGWLNGMGKTRITGYRYRQQGLVSTVNIFGRLYITREEIAAFERRAVSGEFSKEANTPKRQNTGAK